VALNQGRGQQQRVAVVIAVIMQMIPQPVDALVTEQTEILFNGGQRREEKGAVFGIVIANYRDLFRHPQAKLVILGTYLLRMNTKTYSSLPVLS